MSPQDVLTEERAHLARARAALNRMRESALALDASTASDAISGEVLSATLARRVAALTDDPATTLFFGRIDRQVPDQRDVERLYIGRRHVSDDDGDPLVIDWRAPVSSAFYRASVSDPMGVSLRRRFGVEKGLITAFEDENLGGGGLEAGQNATAAASGTGSGWSASEILAQEIERPRSGPMRDIVSTIQPEQDELVRADVGETVVIQGAPGTGKTAVGLHRAAWLLYTFRAKLDRSGVLVVGPNAAFLDHISAVLPSLGEARVQHATVESLLGTWAVKGEDDPARAVLKGDARWAAIIHRAVWSFVGEPDEALVVPRGSRRWRVPAYEIREIIEDLRRREVRYDAARAMMAQALAHRVLLQMEASGDSPDDRVQDAVARSAPVKAVIKALWPKLDAATVVWKLLSDKEFLHSSADGDLTEAEMTTVLWPKPPRSRGSARWSLADLALLDEAADALDRTPSYGHVILDEAQDLSPMQLRAVGRRCSTGSATVLGDLAQATTPWAAGSWEATTHHLGKPAYRFEELLQGFRVPASVIEYAARLLPSIAPELKPPQAVRSNRGGLAHHEVTSANLAGTVEDLVRQLRDTAGSIGVIATRGMLDQLASTLAAHDVELGHLDLRHGDAQDHQVELVPADVAKGLEFDRVIVVEPHEIAEAEPDARTGLRRLYVVLTRAVSELHVVHAQPLPESLRLS